MYIRIKIGKINKEIIQKGTQASDKALVKANDENKFRIYPLIVDMGLTNLAFNFSHEIKTYIMEYVDKKPSSSIYICDNGVKSVSSRFSKAGILVLKKNTGSSTFQNDVLNNNVEFIVLQNTNFIVNYDSIVDQRIQQFLKDKSPYSSNANDVICFLIFSPANHTVIDNTKLSSDCQHRVLPFIGNMVRIPGSEYFIDINVELFSSTITEAIPIHMIGYKTM